MADSWGDQTPLILRVARNEDGQQFEINVNVWDDPAAWGLLIADLITHVAVAYSRKLGNPPTDNANRIIEGLNAELTTPSNES